MKHFNFNFQDKLDKILEYRKTCIPKSLTKSYFKVLFWDDGDFEIRLIFSDAYLYPEMQIRYMLIYKLSENRYKLAVQRDIRAENWIEDLTYLN